MNNIFFFIKHLLGRQSNFIIYFIIFDLVEKSDLQHFIDSIYRGIFLKNEKREILQTIYFKAAMYRFKIKRLVHRYRWKRTQISSCKVDLYQNPLSNTPYSQKISIIQNEKKFTFRLRDLSTMWLNVLTFQDSIICKPLPLKNPYTGVIFKKHNLYNIFFAFHNSSLYFPPIIHSFMKLDFNLKEFKIVYYPYLQDIAINKYHRDGPDSERFDDIIHMLDYYAPNYHHNLDSAHIHINNKNKIMKQLSPFLKSFYFASHSLNPLLKRTYEEKLQLELPTYLKKFPL